VCPCVLWLIEDALGHYLPCGPCKFLPLKLNNLNLAQQLCLFKKYEPCHPNTRCGCLDKVCTKFIQCQLSVCPHAPVYKPAMSRFDCHLTELTHSVHISRLQLGSRLVRGSLRKNKQNYPSLLMPELKTKVS
jgi:hypothetical protein